LDFVLFVLEDLFMRGTGWAIFNTIGILSFVFLFTFLLRELFKKENQKED
jgi:hypothetical protein